MKSLVLSVVDIETTGLSQEKGHRIIEVAIALFRFQFSDDNTYSSSKQVGKTWSQRINPCRSIDPKAQAVHGITLASLRDEPLWDHVAPKVNKILQASDVAVAHNVEFDMPFIALELLRIGESIPEVETFCTLEKGRSATGLGTVPSLQKLCWAMSVPYDANEAHAADYDVNCTAQSLIKGLQLGYFNLNEVLDKKYLKEEAA